MRRRPPRGWRLPPAAAAAGAAGFGAGWPRRQALRRLVAAGRRGAGRRGGVAGAGGAADTPAPGASVRDTSAFNPARGFGRQARPAGLSAAAVGGVGGALPASPVASGSRQASRVVSHGYTHSSAPFCQA